MMAENEECLSTLDGPEEKYGTNSRFVNSNRAHLIQNVKEVMPIADVLLQRNMIHQETYDEIIAATTSQKQMRLLFRAVDCGGDEVKAAFYNFLKKDFPHLVQGTEVENAFKKAQEDLKSSLKMKYWGIFEGTDTDKNKVNLNDIYTKLYITTGISESVNDAHEVWQIETTSRRKHREETAIHCKDIFKQGKNIRTVLTKGIAGIGKTVSVQKFILDWAEGKENKDINFICVLPFRELNLIKNERCSLFELLCKFHKDLKLITNAKSIDSKPTRVLLIFDGLDENKDTLNFKQNEMLSDISETSSVDLLLINLIKGNLMPSALLWITTRPAASNQIPPDCVDLVTEIQGFNDSQKEEYFRRRFNDQSLLCQTMGHIKASRSLYIMCHIPIFCWIIATVTEQMLGVKGGEHFPTTLTEMYTHFLLIQTNTKKKKYSDYKEEKSNQLSEQEKGNILKLGKLAFQQLEKGNIIFYEKDLEMCGIDVKTASVCSGICTKIFKKEFGLYENEVYCFVHLTMQEFLAALYVFQKYTTSNRNLLDRRTSLNFRSLFRMITVFDLHRSAVDEALESENGHLDLFLRFLLGISLESNQTLLQGLLTRTKNSSDSIKKTAGYIKEKIKENLSPERLLNLCHCLNEVKDHSLVKEIQSYLSSGNNARKLSPAECSALAYMLLTSQEELDIFEVKKYTSSDEGLLRLMPVVQFSRKALLDRCNLTDECCEALASVLSSDSSNLRELDLSDNDLLDSGVELLCAGLGNPNCKLETLRLSNCHYTMEACASLASALKSNLSHLRELDLSYNHPGDSGVKLLSAVLDDVSCKLEKLKFIKCKLTDNCCKELASVLRSCTSHLRELDLSENNLLDSGMELFSSALGNPHCKLEILRISGCQVTERGCATLASALRLNPSHLRELDLSYNHPGDTGVKLLSAVLKDPSSKLEKLDVDHGGECRINPWPRKYFSWLTLDPNTAHIHLSLSEGKRRVTWTSEKQPYPDHPERFDHSLQVLCRESLTGRCYWEAECKDDVARIGVTYKGIKRKGGKDSWLGRNDKSWCLCRSHQKYSVWHNKHIIFLVQPVDSHRVGVYLDWAAGTLSFYTVSSDGPTHLYTFTSTFTEPLYPGFTICSESSVSLCTLE